MRLCSGAGPFKNWGALKNPLIVALDVPDENAALRLVEELADAVRFYKIGLQLFTRCGPRVVEAVKGTGAKVFLDLKYHDIPNTVRHGVESACGLGVHMLTVHLSGGRSMCEAAVVGRGISKTLLLGVTVLTSLTNDALSEVGFRGSIQDEVLLLAELAKNVGITGLVASPHELALLRNRYGSLFKTVIPGIRPAWSESGDQKRIMTPRQAVDAGADYLVIGRPITASSNPKDAVKRIIHELEQTA